MRERGRNIRGRLRTSMARGKNDIWAGQMAQAGREIRVIDLGLIIWDS